MSAAILLTPCVAAFGQQRYQPQSDPLTPTEIPFQRYFTKDRFDRRITFYTSKNKAGGTYLLAVLILGSGAYSQFRIQDGKILHAQRDFLDVLNGRACLMIVEKLGVKFAEQPQQLGTATGSSEEFRREHTLDRWVEAISAALGAARTLPDIDPRHTLVIGHSEGAQVAASVAASNPFVTHVACLAGAGPTQLFDFLQQARKGKLYDVEVLPDEQVRRLLAQWDEMHSGPQDPNQMWLGHTYAYWTSFMGSSALEQLPRTNARILIAQGSEDGSNASWTVDLVRSTLLAHGKDVTALWSKALITHFSSQTIPVGTVGERSSRPSCVGSLTT